MPERVKSAEPTSATPPPLPLPLPFGADLFTGRGGQAELSVLELTAIRSGGAKAGREPLTQHSRETAQNDDGEFHQSVW